MTHNELMILYGYLIGAGVTWIGTVLVIRKAGYEPDAAAQVGNMILSIGIATFWPIVLIGGILVGLCYVLVLLVNAPKPSTPSMPTYPRATLNEINRKDDES